MSKRPSYSWLEGQSCAHWWGARTRASCRYPSAPEPIGPSHGLRVITNASQGYVSWLRQERYGSFLLLTLPAIACANVAAWIGKSVLIPFTWSLAIVSSWISKSSSGRFPACSSTVSASPAWVLPHDRFRLLPAPSAFSSSPPPRLCGLALFFSTALLLGLLHAGFSVVHAVVRVFFELRLLLLLLLILRPTCASQQSATGIRLFPFVPRTAQRLRDWAGILAFSARLLLFFPVLFFVTFTS